MSDLISRQAAIDAMCSACGHDCDKSEFVYNAPQDEQVIMCPEHYALSTLPSAQGCKYYDAESDFCALNRPAAQPQQRWIRCDQPPQDERNVFLAHGTNDFKSCCIGHYDHSMKKWYEDKNWFASPIYDCKYWCDIPDLPDMGDKQFEMPEPNEEMTEGER